MCKYRAEGLSSTSLSDANTDGGDWDRKIRFHTFYPPPPPPIHDNKAS